MASAVRSNATSADVAALLPKYENADSDIRFMTLIDLSKLLDSGPPAMLQSDLVTATKTTDCIVKLLSDTNGDVQSQALKSIGSLGAKLPPITLKRFIDRLTTIDASRSLDTSIPVTAAKTLVRSLPRPVFGVPPAQPVQHAYSAVSHVLIPRLLGSAVIPFPQTEGIRGPTCGMLDIDAVKGADAEAIDLLQEVIRCFGPMLQDTEKQAALDKLVEILEDRRTGNIAKKKAVAALSVLSVHLSDQLLGSFVSGAVESFRATHLRPQKRRLLTTMVGSIARAIPGRFGPYLKTLVPFVLNTLSQQELEDMLEDTDECGSVKSHLEEVKEAALTTLEDFLSSCIAEMRSFTNDVIDASLRYVVYDPSFVQLSDDEEMGGTQDDEDAEGEEAFDADEDFEEEAALSDSDDSSWRIRRCAAKVIYTMISTRGSDDLMDSGLLYEKVVPVLVKRFDEREENVRLEVLSALALLVRKTGEGLTPTPFVMEEAAQVQDVQASASRKRRRGGSDASMVDLYTTTNGFVSPGQTPSPVSGPRADLGRFAPTIVRGVIKILKQSSIPSRQAATSLLKDFVKVEHGRLADQIDQVVEPLLEIIKTSSPGGGSSTISASGAASATGNTLRIESLQLLSAICDTHSSRIILPYIGKITSSLVAAIGDSQFKISGKAIEVSESVMKALTPPRALGAQASVQAHIEVIFDAVTQKARASDTELEVRHSAIHALGVCLARAAGHPKLLPIQKRSDAASILQDRLRNETTRLASIQAIDIIARSKLKPGDLDAVWVQAVTVELANQLRKADRTLRTSSLVALQRLIAKAAVLDVIDDTTIANLTALLRPLLRVDNMSQLGPTLITLAYFVKKAPKLVVEPCLDQALCELVKASLSDHALDALLKLIETIGASGSGRPLMQGLLLNVGVGGDPAVVGSAIGTLLVSGASSVGIDVNDIENELRTEPDDKRKCLALCILGEAGLRLGTSSSIEPKMFLEYFRSKSDQVPRVAAVALGRAGAGNVSHYLPIILSTMRSATDKQCLLLHSIKEILHYTAKVHSDIATYTHGLWENLFELSDSEDNRAVGAECIGRLLTIEPRKFLPRLQDHLNSASPSTRGMVIQAIRYAFSDSDETFDQVLKPILVEMLTTMLRDSSLDNRRLALTTLNAATNNKISLILHHLPKLVQYVVQNTEIDPTLVREVQMGPFKLKVDDGLEIRKNAYETLRALMNTAYPRLNPLIIFDRVVAGLKDDQDIKMLCNLMITKLVALDPEEMSRRLDSIAEAFTATLSVRLKDNAVRQEIEKAQEASKDILRTSIRLNEAFPHAATAMGGSLFQAWKTYWEWISKEMKAQLIIAEEEVRSQQ